MTEWTLNIDFNNKVYNLRAIVEYEDREIIRIRLYGSKRTLLFENDYPMIHNSSATRGVNWKFVEGRMDRASSRNAGLLMGILRMLEENLKEELTRRDRNRLFG